MIDLASLIAAARAHTPGLLGKIGAFTTRESVGPLGAAQTLGQLTYPYTKDSNFPGVAQARAEHRVIPHHLAVPGFSGVLAPNDRVAEGFNTLASQPPVANADAISQYLSKPAPQPPPQTVQAAPQPQQPAQAPGLDQFILDHQQNPAVPAAAPQQPLTQLPQSMRMGDVGDQYDMGGHQDTINKFLSLIRPA